MDKPNQALLPVVIVPTDHTLILSWNIATEPKLYRELAQNPYSPGALRLILERFPDYAAADIIRAVILAEPEGKYERDFKQLSQELQKEEGYRQAGKTSNISRSLNEYYTAHKQEFRKLSEGSIFESLIKAAFGVNDLKEIEERFTQKQRIDFKLLIARYVQEFETETFIYDIPLQVFGEHLPAPHLR